MQMSYVCSNSLLDSFAQLCFDHDMLHCGSALTRKCDKYLMRSDVMFTAGGGAEESDGGAGVASDAREYGSDDERSDAE